MDTFKVGEAGDLQILATREDSPEDGGVAFWDDTNKRFNTDTGFIWDDVNKKTWYWDYSYSSFRCCWCC